MKLYLYYARTLKKNVFFRYIQQKFTKMRFYPHHTPIVPSFCEICML